MSAPIVEARTRQVVVVFRGGGDAGLAGVLASLVSGGEAEVAGIFLEDNALFRMAELPFALEVSRLTSSQRPVRAVQLEREMKVVAARAEGLLRAVAEPAGLRWSFRKLRGRLRAALEEVRDVDFVLLGAGYAMAPAETVRTPERERRRPIAVAWDSSAASKRALAAGVQLANTTGRRLIVFCKAGEAMPEQPLGVGRVAFETVADEDETGLLRAVRRAAPVVLLIGAGESGFGENEVEQLRRGLRCPMLVAR